MHINAHTPADVSLHLGELTHKTGITAIHHYNQVEKAVNRLVIRRKASFSDIRLMRTYLGIAAEHYHIYGMGPEQPMPPIDLEEVSAQLMRENTTTLATR